jgi:hypothetical protein
MLIAVLILSGAVLAAFLILVAGIRSTDRSRGLRDPAHDSRAEAFARRVLGVYADRPRPKNATSQREYTRR